LIDTSPLPTCRKELFEGATMSKTVARSDELESDEDEEEDGEGTLSSASKAYQEVREQRMTAGAMMSKIFAAVAKNHSSGESSDFLFLDSV
jgi:hypothetical protein